MLRDLDKKLIERESHRFNTKEVKRWLDPLGTCHTVSSIDVLKNQYNLHEMTEHWYDSIPKFNDISCDLCNKKIYCRDCPTWKKWQNSEDQLSYINWIDVYGPGIWGCTQKKANYIAFKTLEDKILNDKDFFERAWYYQPSDKNYFYIFYYSRDTEGKRDYWFIFKKKS